MKGLGAAVLLVFSTSVVACGSQPPAAADASSQSAVDSPASPATASARAAAPKPCTATTLAADLAGELQSLERESGLETLQAKARACEGVGRVTLIDGKSPALGIELVDAVDAGELAQAWSIERPFLISTTVHQSFFSLVGTEDRPTGEQRHFDKSHREIGAWEVRIQTKRPEGPLPAERFGPAPAYDLRAYKSVVTHLSIRPRA